jgi:SPP1 gp7 family putative phage head morphogenesis protein
MASVDFKITQRIEQAYARAIRKLIVPAFPAQRPDQSLEDWLAEIAQLSERRDIADAAAFIAGQMARWVNVVNARGWREASARAQRSQMLYRLLEKELQGPVGVRLRRIVKDNASYITKIPREISEKLTADIAHAQQAGLRPKAIERMMRERFPKMTRNRIRLIARTESMKASAALTESRADELGLPAYEWITSRDSRVRPSHRNLDGVIVLYSDPPAPEALIGQRSTLGRGHAGCFPQCRCPQAPLLTLDDVRWPHRVHRHGSIVMMTRVEFANWSGLRERRAA